jgi:hypothetical protein
MRQADLKMRPARPSLIGATNLHWADPSQLWSSTLVEMHTKGMLLPVAITLKPAEIAATSFKRLFHRKYQLLVPEWDDSRYGRLSAGLFWEAEQARRRRTRLMRFWAAWHYTLGSIAIALAAFAGFGSLGQILGEKTAAFIIIGSGIAMGLATFLRSDDNRRKNEELAVAWEKQMDDVALLYEIRPEETGSSPQADEPKAPRDPEGWQAIAQSLRERAQSIRAGETKLEPRPAWPNPERGQVPN